MTVSVRETEIVTSSPHTGTTLIMIMVTGELEKVEEVEVVYEMGVGV